MKFIYVADPMCSWCYGFGQTLDALLKSPGPAAPMQLAVLMGGLRPYTTEPMAPGTADEIRGHWERVAALTGLPFSHAPDTALQRRGFIYDTEPAARAVVAVRMHWPAHVWKLLRAIQHAFYAEGRDVTRPEVLADVAESVGIPRDNFATAFASDAARDATRTDFEQAQAWGLRAFPALIAEHKDALHLLAQGHAPLDDLRERIDALLAGKAAPA